MTDTGHSVVFKFNRALLIVGNGDTVRSVFAAYDAQVKADRKPYGTPQQLAEKKP